MWKIGTNSNTGTTVDIYTNALDWKTAELAQKTILLKNTHLTESLKYHLSGYAVPGDIARELVAETSLLAGEVAEFHYDRQWHRLVLQLKDGSGVAAYQIDY